MRLRSRRSKSSPRDSDLFDEGVRKPETQNRLQAALNRGFQTRDAEMNLARFIGELSNRNER
jgi:predicted secreted protein